MITDYFKREKESHAEIAKPRRGEMFEQPL